MTESSHSLAAVPPQSGGALAPKPAGVLALPEWAPDAQENENAEGVDLLKLLRVIWRRKWLILSVLILATVTTTLISSLITPVYRSTILLQIDYTPPKLLTFGEAARAEPIYRGKNDFYETQYQILQSRSLAKRVVEQMNLGQNPVFMLQKPSPWEQWISQPLRQLWAGGGTQPPEGKSAVPLTSEQANERAVGRFLGSLGVTPVKDSRLVRLSFSSFDRQLSANVLNTLAQVFMNLEVDRRYEASAFTRNFLKEQLEETKVKLQAAETKLTQYARSQEIVNVETKDGTVHAQKFAAMSAALLEAERARIQAETDYRTLMSDQGQGHTAILDNTVVQKLKESRANLEAEYQQNRKIFKPAYPKMLQLQEQITELDQQIEREVRNVRAAAKTRYDSLRQQEQSLRARVAALQEDVLKVQDNRATYEILRREVDSNRALYDNLLQRVKEAELANNLELNQISVVDAAEPGGQIKPDTQGNLQLALLLGLVGGLGLAFLFEHLDDTVQSLEELEKRIGISALGVVPIAKTEKGVAPALLVKDQPRSGFAEALRSIRTALMYSTAQGAPKLLHLTSTSAGEGKSTCAVSLAAAFAQTGGSVLLIDADLRKPSLHNVLNISNESGLTDYLTGDAKPADISRSCVLPNVFVIPAGTLPPNPAELLAGHKFLDLLRTAEQRFTHVIIDGPPVLGLADALILANLVRNTVMVVESQVTRPKQLRGAIKRLRSANAHIIGGILTKLRRNNQAGRSGDYYNYHYNYQTPYGGTPTAEVRQFPANPTS